MENQFDLQIEITKSGHPTLKIFQGDHVYYLHSKYNPVREAEVWAEGFYEKGKTTILIGLGLGFQVKELLKIMDPKDRILVIEPYEKILDVAKEFGLDEIFTDQRVLFCMEQEKEKLAAILRGLIVGRYFKDSKIYVASNYDKIFSATELIERLKRSFLDYRYDLNTILEQATDWQQNYFKNIKYAVDSCPVTIFEQKFSCPVIIVSAGPSLNMEIEKLKKLTHHALIISAGTATPVLVKNNIKPHIIITIDGHMENYKHFKEIDYNEIPLFYAANNHYKITEKHVGPKVVFQWSGIEISDWFDETIGFKTGNIKTGPSVANFAFDIACKMTSGPICFVGQDLGYVGGFSHAEGNINRVSASAVTTMPLLPEESNDGSELYTDYSFVHMREWFENYLTANKRENIYNSSTKGAKIKGTTAITLEKFIDSFCQEENDVSKRIAEIMQEWKCKYGDRVLQTNKILEDMLVCVNNITETTQNAKKLSKKLLNKVKNKDEKNIDALLSKLTESDKEIAVVTRDNGLLYFIILPMNYIMVFWEEEDSDDYKKRMNIAEKNYFFYSMLDEMASVVKKILREELAAN